MLPNTSKLTPLLFSLGVCNLLFAQAAETKAQSVGGFFVFDGSKVVDGGVTNDSVGRALAGISIEVALAESFAFYAEAQVQRGDNGSDDVGDIQAYSNIDEDDFTKLYEVWLEGQILDNLRLKTGLIDANTEFAFVDNGGEFINSSMGFSPTIAFLPTYPKPTLAVTGFYKASDTTQLALGVFSDDSNDFDQQFFIGEFQWQTDAAMVKLGAWQFSGKVESLADGALLDKVEGFYVAAEGEFPRSFWGADSTGWFIQYGNSSDDFSEIDTHIGGGLVWSGVVGRADDLSGIGITDVTISKYLRPELASRETIYEVFYRYQVNDYIALKPDIQYVKSPALAPMADDTLVATMRLEMTW